MVSQYSTPDDEEKRIRVVIVEDNAVTLRVLKLFVSSCADLQLVGTATNDVEARYLCDRTRPDVVVMDLQTPAMDSLKTTRLIRRLYPHIQVVVLSMSTDTGLRCQALEAGALGYVSKFDLDDEFIQCIHAAAAGMLPQPSMTP